MSVNKFTCILFAPSASFAQTAELPKIAVFPPLVHFDTAQQQSSAVENRLNLDDLANSIEETLRSTRQFKVIERNPEILKSTVFKEIAVTRSDEPIDPTEGGSKTAYEDAIKQYGLNNGVDLIIQPINMMVIKKRSILFLVLFYHCMLLVHV